MIKSILVVENLGMVLPEVQILVVHYLGNLDTDFLDDGTNHYCYLPMTYLNDFSNPDCKCWSMESWSLVVYRFQ